jgi:hypothetical protein
MKDIIESLSLGSGAVVVALCSAALAWFLSNVRVAVVRWLGCVVIPLALASVLYWLPVWLGSRDVAQHSTWSFLVVGLWFLAGLASSIVVLFACARRAN